MRLVGAPFNSAGLADGVAAAPQALRDAGLVANAGLSDGGDVDVGVLRPERDADSGLLADLGSGTHAAPAFAREATTAILREVEHWWLHVDLDVLSTEALPAVDYPQDGGLSWTQLESLTGAALKAPGCLGISVCIYNPDLDPARHHATRIVEFIAHLGGLISPFRVAP